MHNKLSRTLIFVFLVVLLSPLAIIFFYGQIYLSLWIWSWFLLFAWFIHTKREYTERGYLFIVGSVAIAVLGKPFIEIHSDDEKIFVEVFTQVFILVGGGVGGNFIAQGLFNKDHHKKIPVTKSEHKKRQ